MSNRETEAELLGQLAQLDRQIDERRGARHLASARDYRRRARELERGDAA